MGVTGLLQVLKSYSQSQHVSQYTGMRLGVDGYAWLHRAAACCADDLVNGRDTLKLVQSIENRIRLYEHHNIELYFVFDGASIAMKARIEKERRAKRDAAKAKKDRLGGDKGYANFMRAVDITAHHAAMVIALLKQRKIPYVVAPFEADAQLVWLERNNLVDGIISEDSDLLVFGAQRLLTKSDPKSGMCVEVHSPNLPPHFRDLAHLRALAIISGCDYSPGINGLGPVKTTALVKRMNGDLEAILNSLKLEGRASDEFVATARQADLAFQYQHVWNVRTKAVNHLSVLVLEEGESESPLTASLTAEVVGRKFTREEAYRIAVGVDDPHNQKQTLVVTPLVAQYVVKLKPYAVIQRKPTAGLRSTHDTPSNGKSSAVAGAINRRLMDTSSKGEKVCSPFFKTQSQSTRDHSANKENDLYNLKMRQTSIQHSVNLPRKSSQPLASHEKTIPVDLPKKEDTNPDQPTYPPNSSVKVRSLAQYSFAASSSVHSARSTNTIAANPPAYGNENSFMATATSELRALKRQSSSEEEVAPATKKRSGELHDSAVHMQEGARPPVLDALPGSDGAADVYESVASDYVSDSSEPEGAEQAVRPAKLDYLSKFKFSA